jgi:hypothetical protein
MAACAQLLRQGVLGAQLGLHAGHAAAASGSGPRRRSRHSPRRRPAWPGCAPVRGTRWSRPARRRH